MNAPQERFGFPDAVAACDIIGRELARHGLNIKNIKDGVVLGSSLNNFPVDHVDKGAVNIPFNTIFSELGIPPLETNVKGHPRSLVIGPLAGDTQDNLLFVQGGREHPYEDVETERTTFWIRVMQLLGVETLFGSNAVGIVTPHTMQVPSLMLVMDHRDYANDNPLVGANDDRLGPRFPHTGDLYPAASRILVKEVAARLGIALPEGILFRLKGPEYENKATVYDLRRIARGIYDEARLDKDTEYQGEPTAGTGMSATIEHLVAQHASPIQNTASEQYPNRAFGRGRVQITAGTNYACGLGPDGQGAFPDHEEVSRNAAIVRESFGKLARETILALRPQEEAPPIRGVLNET